MTYKILYNDAVAMTGGQRHDGPLDPAMISRQIAAEGVKPIVVVTDEPEKYPHGTNWAPGVTVRHRDELDAVQRELREMPGRVGADLRPDLRLREAPPPQAQRVSRSREARGHQRDGVRGLRRLQRQVELPVGRAARDRVRPQARDQPVVLQQGLLLREGLLPELRHGRRRAAEEGQVRAPCRRTKLSALRRAGSAGARRSPTASWSPASAAPASSPSARSSAWRRTSKARACSVLDMSGLAQKYGAVMSHVQVAAHAGGPARHAPRHRRREPGARLRPGRHREHRGDRQDGAGAHARGGQRHASRRPPSS